MANPNKKDGKSYLMKFGKEELVDKIINLDAIIYDLEAKLTKYEKEKASLEKKNNSMQRIIDRHNTSDVVLKKILQYRARCLTPTSIKEKLELDGITINIQAIKDIINSELDTENRLYYEKCQAEYLESIQINTKLYKMSSIEELQKLIDSAQEDLNKCESDDLKTRANLRNEISNYTEKRDKLMKNIDETNTSTEEEIILNETMEQYKEFSEQVFNFASLGKVDKIVGGKSEKLQ